MVEVSTSVIFSTPAATTTSSSPEATAITAWRNASEPEQQADSTRVDGMWREAMPAWSAIRAPTCSCSTKRPADMLPT